MFDSLLAATERGRQLILAFQGNHKSRTQNHSVILVLLTCVAGVEPILPQMNIIVVVDRGAWCKTFLIRYLIFFYQVA